MMRRVVVSCRWPASSVCGSRNARSTNRRLHFTQLQSALRLQSPGQRRTAKKRSGLWGTGSSKKPLVVREAPRRLRRRACPRAPSYGGASARPSFERAVRKAAVRRGAYAPASGEGVAYTRERYSWLSSYKERASAPNSLIFAIISSAVLSSSICSVMNQSRNFMQR